MEELACFQYSLNDKNSNYREKQSLILRLPPAYCWYTFQYRVERDNVEQSFLETTYGIEVTNLASKQQPSTPTNCKSNALTTTPLTAHLQEIRGGSLY